MDEDRKVEEREAFELLSGEYAQALQAFEAIRQQASTIVTFGGSSDLRALVDRFLEMAERTRALALERNQPHFVEWFDELIGQAAELRGEIVRK